MIFEQNVLDAKARRQLNSNYFDKPEITDIIKRRHTSNQDFFGKFFRYGSAKYTYIFNFSNLQEFNKICLYEFLKGTFSLLSVNSKILIIKIENLSQLVFLA